jgi:hypothetical protein
LVRFIKDRNNGIIDFKWVDKFNARIELWSLMEIGVSRRNYIWGNNQETHVMCKLDRIFCTNFFDSNFPSANARALSRLANSGEARIPKKRRV